MVHQSKQQHCRKKQYEHSRGGYYKRPFGYRAEDVHAVPPFASFGVNSRSCRLFGS